MNDIATQLILIDTIHVITMANVIWLKSFCGNRSQYDAFWVSIFFQLSIKIPANESLSKCLLKQNKKKRNSKCYTTRYIICRTFST